MLYIDTENTFRPEKIVGIADRFGMDKESILANIAVAQAKTVEAQFALLHQAAALMIEERYVLLSKKTQKFQQKTKNQQKSKKNPTQRPKKYPRLTRLLFY